MRGVRAFIMVVLYFFAVCAFFFGVLALFSASSLHEDVRRDYIEYLESISQGVIAVACFLVTTVLTLWANAILRHDDWSQSKDDSERTRRAIELMMMAQNKRRKKSEQ